MLKIKKNLTEEEQTYLRDFVVSFADPALVRAMVMDIVPEDTVTVNATYGVETAFHYYDHGAKEHKIFIGTDYESLHDSLDDRDQVKQYVLALLVHELGHANYTDLDGKAISEECKKEKIPFALWNTAEDARIEIKMRQLILDKIDINYMFGWEKWLPNPQESADMSPEAILLTMINCENSRPVNAIRAKRVGQYYTRFVNASDSFEVIDILKEWRDEFYSPSHNMMNDMSKGMSGEDAAMQAMQAALQEALSQMNQALGGKGNQSVPGPSGDETVSVGCQTGEIDINALEAASLSITRAMQEQRELNQQIRCKGNFGDVAIEEASNTDKIFKGEPKFYLKDEYELILKHFRKILTPIETNRAQRMPTRTLNVKALGLTKSSPNTQNIYKKKEQHKNEKGKKILFVLDLSGSMGGYAVYSQRTIALAANTLAKNSRYSIDLIGSKVLNDVSLHQAISLPYDDKNILAMEANGESEGIADAVTNSKQYFASKDIVIFITDGDIHDKKVSKKFFQKYINPAAKTIGVFVGGHDGHNHKMADWFDYFIKDESVSAAVEKFVHIIMHGKEKKQPSNPLPSSGAPRGRKK
ncbi:MAG: hypothetical protein PHT07_10745 [Paludibacter sp.]|nr:hypothetical protein [Paludibacter sp.]